MDFCRYKTHLELKIIVSFAKPLSKPKFTLLTNKSSQGYCLWLVSEGHLILQQPRPAFTNSLVGPWKISKKIQTSNFPANFGHWWISLLKLSFECHCTLLMISPTLVEAMAWCRQVYDPDLCRHMAWLRHNELNWVSCIYWPTAQLGKAI